MSAPNREMRELMLVVLGKMKKEKRKKLKKNVLWLLINRKRWKELGAIVKRKTPLYA